MSASHLSDVPNPFSLADAASGRAKRGNAPRRAFWKAAKGLLLVSIVLSGLIGAKYFGERWLLSTLTADLQSLPPDEQRVRLIQIDSMGELAIPVLAQSLATRNIETARTAFELLSEGQSRWPALGKEAAVRRQAVLVRSLGTIATELADDRTGWATQLVQQAVLESVDQSDQASEDLFDLANRTLGLLALSQRSGPSILSSQLLDDEPPRRLIVRSIPLPVDRLDQVEQWSRWPSEAELGNDLQQPVHPQPSNPHPVPRSKVTLAPVQPRAKQSEALSTTVISSGQSSAIKLAPIQPGHKVMLEPVATASPAPAATAPAEIHAVGHYAQASMIALTDRSVMQWLISEQPQRRTQAQNELYSRGYRDPDLELARQMVDPSTEVRLALVARISRHPAIDPRPWLRMMSADEDRTVRLEVVSVLATMNDPEAKGRLQKMLTVEPDRHVASRIRDALAL